MACKKCGEEGHNAQRCQKNMCIYCNSDDHITRDCPYGVPIIPEGYAKIRRSHCCYRPKGKGDGKCPGRGNCRFFPLPEDIILHNWNKRLNSKRSEEKKKRSRLMESSDAEEDASEEGGNEQVEIPLEEEQRGEREGEHNEEEEIPLVVNRHTSPREPEQNNAEEPEQNNAEEPAVTGPVTDIVTYPVNVKTFKETVLEEKNTFVAAIPLTRAFFENAIFLATICSNPDLLNELGYSNQTNLREDWKSKGVKKMDPKSFKRLREQGAAFRMLADNGYHSTQLPQKEGSAAALAKAAPGNVVAIWQALLNYKGPDVSEDYVKGAVDNFDSAEAIANLDRLAKDINKRKNEKRLKK